MLIKFKKLRVFTRSQIIRKVSRLFFLCCTVLQIVSVLFSCVDPIKFDKFADKNIKKKSSKSALAVKTVLYKHNDKIVFSWNKIRNATSYYLYEFKNTTGTLASKKDPDDVVHDKTQHTITIKSSEKEKNVMQTRYLIVEARDSKGKILFTSKMIEGKTLGNPLVIKEAGHIERTYCSVTFQWASVEGVDKYSVKRRKEGNPSYTTPGVLVQSPEKYWEFVDENVESNSEYFYKITAYVMDGEKEIAKSNYEFPVTTPAPSVENVQASDVDYDGDEGIYIAKHGAESSRHNSKTNLDEIDREAEISYATKITWDKPSCADKYKYHIYRMDFNEPTNFWRKIGERDADEEQVFFDTNALLLREYRAMYWVVAVEDKESSLNFDASLKGNPNDPNDKPENTKLEGVIPERFNAERQDELIKRMSKEQNVDVGSRWITPREYLNWSLAVIGEAVYDLYNEDSYEYGISRSSWSYLVDFTMNNYSFGARARKITNNTDRKKRKSTELVVNTKGGLSGSFTESCPKGGESNLAPISCRGAIMNSRLGTYAGNKKNINVFSPYGNAIVKISGEFDKGLLYSSHSNGVHYDFNKGTLHFTWLEKNYTFSNANNTGTQGPLNPHVTIIRFNRDYDTFFKAVYGSS